MKKTNYQSVLLSCIPMGILLFFVLKSEFRTEGEFGGLVEFVKYAFFLMSGIVVFVYTFTKQWKHIKHKTEVSEAKIILSVLFIATFIAIVSFWIPKDFFDTEAVFIAKDASGNELQLLGAGKYMLRTRDYEWTTIDRGMYQLNDSMIFLDKDIKERKWGKRARKYLIQNKSLIPLYTNGIETDSTGFLSIRLNMN
ncbi:hypothetical protein [Kordia sp.]|uniref:hypothetical protein n=1 Tax=Kordia sp. TaxID=1965332 RepID=UPI0025BD88B9|nr:hypothetical protein [Kordia sp.]MCH2193134.1 hypothetical protein [Kordia sp.]